MWGMTRDMLILNDNEKEIFIIEHCSIDLLQCGEGTGVLGYDRIDTRAFGRNE